MAFEDLGNYNWFQGSAFAGTAASLVKTGAGVVFGVIVGSNSAGSFKLYDGVTAVNPIVGSYTPATGSSVVSFPAPLKFQAGLFFHSSGIAGGAKIEDAKVIFS